MHFAQYDGQVYPQRWASLPILMGKVAQRLGQILKRPLLTFLDGKLQLLTKPLSYFEALFY